MTRLPMNLGAYDFMPSSQQPVSGIKRQNTVASIRKHLNIHDITDKR